MDVAVAIFNIGAGLGVLAVGAALVYLAWQATPLIRESRALTADLRRLARTADEELRPLIGSVEVLSEDAAVKLDRLGHIMTSLEEGLSHGRLTATAGRSESRPVESWHMREDSTDS